MYSNNKRKMYVTYGKLVQNRRDVTTHREYKEFECDCSHVCDVAN